MKKYIYNEKSCCYEQEKNSLSKYCFFFIKFLLANSIFSLSVFCFFKNNITEKIASKAKQENEFLKVQYMKLNNEIRELKQTALELEERDQILYRTLFNTPTKFRKTHSKPADESVPLSFDNFMVDKIEHQLAILKDKIIEQRASYIELVNISKKREAYLESIPAIQPISDMALKRIGDTFRMRECHPIHRVAKMHEGIDYVAPTGTKVFATGAGIIKTAKYTAGYGNVVIINHGNGTETRYAHLSAFNNIKKGDKVYRGSCIGFVGSTGIATGPHLHYEIIVNRKKIDPFKYFVADLNLSQYNQVLMLASSKERNVA